MSFNLINPIPEAIKDPKKLQKFFEKWDIVPYYGDEASTSHSMLQVLRNASELSPTHNACKTAIQRYTFGNSIDVKTQSVDSIPGFTNKTSEPLPPLPDSEKEAYLNKLLDLGINLLQVQQLNRLLYNNLTDSGNAYLHIKILKIGTEYRVLFNSISYLEAAFLATKSIEDKALIVTKYWNEEYWKQVKPTIFKSSDWIYPFKWDIRRKDTIYETVVHIKNVKDENIYYGRPNTLSVLNHMFIEYANSDLECKVSGSELVTKTLLLFQEADPSRTRAKKVRKDKEGNTKSKKNQKTAFQQYMQAVKQLTTAEGNYLEASSIAGLSYPFGSDAPTSVNLEVNRDYQYSDSVQARAAKKICSTGHNWDRRLTGDEETKGSLGSNLIINLLIQRNESTIVPNRNFWESFWCQTLKEIGKIVSPGEVMHCFEFPDVVDGVVTKLREGESKIAETVVEPVIEENIID